ncbi:hypothetical protein V6N13_118637 [Hibiscus sabdariffa]
MFEPTHLFFMRILGQDGNKILRLLDEMRSKGLKFDEFTCSTVISACGREELLNEAKDSFSGLKSQGYVPGTVTYNALLEDERVRLCTYNAVIGMLGKESRSEEMIMILCDMKESGCSPNCITWNTMLAMCGNKGMHKYVNRVFREMKNCGFEPDRDTLLVPMAARRGDWKAAESVILDMKSKGFKPSETSYSLMLQCYANGGNVKGIENIEKEISDGHIYPSWMLLRTLVLANCRCRAVEVFSKNMYEKAHDHEMLHLIRESGLTPTTA